MKNEIVLGGNWHLYYDNMSIFGYGWLKKYITKSSFIVENWKCHSQILFLHVLYCEYELSLCWKSKIYYSLAFSWLLSIWIIWILLKVVVVNKESPNLLQVAHLEIEILIINSKSRKSIY